MSAPVDPTDPRVRQLAYSMYRDMLGACHGRSTDMVSKAPQGKQVTEDKGVTEQIKNMAQQKTSAQTNGSSHSAISGPASSHNGVNGFSHHGVNGVNGSVNGGIPPPPPPPPGGHVPPQKITSEVSLRSHSPPAVIQNAMATKDKKPFSYLPAGGIDLSEIKSPHMQQRMMNNAMNDALQGQGQKGQSQAQSQPQSSYSQVQSQSQSQVQRQVVGNAGPPAPPPPPPPMPPAPGASQGQQARPARAQVLPQAPVEPQKPAQASSAWAQNLARQRAAASPPAAEKVAPPSQRFGKQQSLEDTLDRVTLHSQRWGKPLSQEDLLDKPAPVLNRWGKQSSCENILEKTTQPAQRWGKPAQPADAEKQTAPPAQRWGKPASQAADKPSSPSPRWGQSATLPRKMPTAQPAQQTEQPTPAGQRWPPAASRASPPAQQTAQQPPDTATLKMAARPPWRVTKNGAGPANGQAAETAPTPALAPGQGKGQGQGQSQGQGPSQARGTLYIPPVAKAPLQVEALPSPPAQAHGPAPWRPAAQMSPPSRAAQAAPPSQQAGRAGPRSHVVYPRAEMAPPAGQQGALRQHQQQQQQMSAQQKSQPQRQHSFGSQRTIPVQLETGPDGKPQVNIGGRIIPVTAEGVQLPVDLIMPQQQQARVIQQVAEKQTRTPTRPSERPRFVPREIPTDSVGDPIPSMRSVLLSEEDKQLMQAFRQQGDRRSQESSHDGSSRGGGASEAGTQEESPLYRGAHIPSRLFRSLEHTVSGGTAPPSRIGGPGQGRAVIVNMPGRPGVAGGQISGSSLSTKNPAATMPRGFRIAQHIGADQQGH